MVRDSAIGTCCVEVRVGGDLRVVLVLMELGVRLDINENGLLEDKSGSTFNPIIVFVGYHRTMEIDRAWLHEYDHWYSYRYAMVQTLAFWNDGVCRRNLKE